MRGKSANPNLAKLDRVAQALKVERNWLIHGLGDVQGEEPIGEHFDDSFVAVSMAAAICRARARASAPLS
jgi:transcriptional regulator with XRE-family HTH domain